MNSVFFCISGVPQESSCVNALFTTIEQGPLFQVHISIGDYLMKYHCHQSCLLYPILYHTQMTKRGLPGLSLLNSPCIVCGEMPPFFRENAHLFSLVRVLTKISRRKRTKNLLVIVAQSARRTIVQQWFHSR